MSQPLDNHPSLQLTDHLQAPSPGSSQMHLQEQLRLPPEEDGTFEHLELFEALLQDQLLSHSEQLLVEERGENSHLQQRESPAERVGRWPGVTSMGHVKKDKKISKERKGSAKMPRGQNSHQKQGKGRAKGELTSTLRRQQNELIQQNSCSQRCLQKAEPRTIVFNPFAFAEDTEGSDPFLEVVPEEREAFSSLPGEGGKEKELFDYQCYLNLS